MIADNLMLWMQRVCDDGVCGGATVLMRLWMSGALRVVLLVWCVVVCGGDVGVHVVALCVLCVNTACIPYVCDMWMWWCRVDMCGGGDVWCMVVV